MRGVGDADSRMLSSSQEHIFVMLGEAQDILFSFYFYVPWEVWFILITHDAISSFKWGEDL